MTNQRRARNSEIAAQALATEGDRSNLPQVFPAGRPTGDSYDQLLLEQEKAAEPGSDTASHTIWETIALWMFVIASFAALAYAGYAIWVKSRGSSPV